MASFTGTYKDELIATANAIAAPGKGILAADESTGTIGKRFAPINVENTQPNRVRYRELLFKTKGLGQYISGAITYEETLFDTATCGTPMVELLKKEGIIPGIKVDKGVQPLFGTNGETVTQGIDDLGKRCAKYYAQGARFAKWRAVLKIDAATHCPTPLSIDQNAETLARYAAICQANGLVPIVEPEVLMDGAISASRGAAAPSRHRRDSCPSDEVVGGFFFEFELFRTVSGPSRRVRETAVASMASSRDSAAATPSS